jgi:hypothetical protein
VVLLDLGRADFIDSGGLAWLIRWYRLAEQAGGTFGLCAVPPRVAEVLWVSELDRVFPIWRDERAAREALGVGKARAAAPAGQTAGGGATLVDAVVNLADDGLLEAAPPDAAGDGVDKVWHDLLARADGTPVNSRPAAAP